MAQRQQATGLILRYIKRTDSGSINYRRVIPEPLRQIIGRREFKRKIGETLSEATRNYGEADREFGLLIRTAQRASSKKHLEAMQAKLTRLQVAERARREYQDLIQSTVWIGGEEFPLTDSDAASFVADVMQDHPSPEARSNPVKATQERLVINLARIIGTPGAIATAGRAVDLYVSNRLSMRNPPAKASVQAEIVKGFAGYRATAHLQAAHLVVGVGTFEGDEARTRDFLALARWFETIVDKNVRDVRFRWNPWRVPPAVRPANLSARLDLPHLTDEERKQMRW